MSPASDDRGMPRLVHAMMTHHTSDEDVLERIPAPLIRYADAMNTGPDAESQASTQPTAGTAILRTAILCAAAAVHAA